MLVGTGHIEDNCTSLNNTATAKMNTVLGFLALCCSVASVHAACNILACSLTGSILGTEGCTTYNLYIECLKDEVGACTSSQVVEKASLDAAITSNTVLMNALPCPAASVPAACNILACSLTGSILGTKGCATYNLYIECLKDEVGACTSSQVVEKASLDAAITSNTVLMNALPCSAAGGIYLSLTSLLMPLIALFMKQ